MGERWRSRRRWRRRRRKWRRNRTVRERRRTWCRNWWWCCCSPQDRLSENIHCLCLNSCCKTPCGPKKGSKQIFPKCTADCFFFTKCYFISRHKDEHLSSQKEIRLKFQKVLSEELKECQWRASITIQLSWETKKLFHGIPWNAWKPPSFTQGLHWESFVFIVKRSFLYNCQLLNLESHSSLSLPLKLDTVVKAAECFYLRFYLRWLPFVIGHILKVGVKRAKYQLKPFYSSNLINFCLSLPTALNEDSTEVTTHLEI